MRNPFSESCYVILQFHTTAMGWCSSIPSVDSGSSCIISHLGSAKCVDVNMMQSVHYSCDIKEEITIAWHLYYTTYSSRPFAWKLNLECYTGMVSQRSRLLVWSRMIYQDVGGEIRWIELGNPPISREQWWEWHMLYRGLNFQCYSHILGMSVVWNIGEYHPATRIFLCWS